MSVLPALADVLLSGVSAALTGAIAGIGTVQVVNIWFPTGLPRSRSRWVMAPLAALTALLGVVASALFQALVWFPVIGNGWVWLPAGVGAVGLVVAHLAIGLQVRRAASAELARPTWQARWDDSVVLARWFRESFGRRGPLLLWAVVPGACLTVVSAGLFVREAVMASADASEVAWYWPALLAAGLVVAGSGWVLVGRLDPKAVLTLAVLARPPHRWHDAQFARRWSLAATARSVDRAVRRRERRLASSTRRRYAEARGVVVEVLLLAEEAGFSAQPPRHVHRDALRVGLRLAVGGDPQAALLAYERWRTRWGLHGVEPGDLPGWTVRRTIEVVGLVSAVASVVVLMVGLVARLVSAAQAGSLIDGLSFLR